MDIFHAMMQGKDILQSYTVARLRTGNAYLDAFIVTLVISFLTIFFHHIMARVEQFDKYLKNFRHNVVIKRYSIIKCRYYNDVFINYDYEAFVWYVTHVLKIKNGCLCVNSIFSPDKKSIETKVFPNDSFEYSIIYKGRCIFYEFKSEKSRDAHGSSIELNEYIVLRTKKKLDMPIILDFVHDIRTQYKQYISETKKVRQLYRLSKESGSKIIWKGAPTHSTKSFDTVILKHEEKEQLLSDLQQFKESEEWYKQMGISYKRGYMFYGSPGMGKSSLILAMANMFNYDIYAMDLSKINSDEQLDMAFESMPENCIVSFEDIDCMSNVVQARTQTQTKECNHLVIEEQNKDDDLDAKTANPKQTVAFGNTTSSSGISLSAFLNHLDGMSNNHGRIFIITTNHVHLLDPALIRPGRVDISIYLTNCDKKQIEDFFDFYYLHKQSNQSKQSNDEWSKIQQELSEVLKKYKNQLSPADISCILQQNLKNPYNAIKSLNRKMV